jgi:hypothetical protein
LTSSLGWLGAVVAYVAVGIAAAANREPQTVRAAWIAMELMGWSVIVPLALAALVTGLVISLGTPWGLFRHYWVLISLALTLLATVGAVAVNFSALEEVTPPNAPRTMTNEKTNAPHAPPRVTFAWIIGTPCGPVTFFRGDRAR